MVELHTQSVCGSIVALTPTGLAHPSFPLFPVAPSWVMVPRRRPHGMVKRATSLKGQERLVRDRTALAVPERGDARSRSATTKPAIESWFSEKPA